MSFAYTVRIAIDDVSVFDGFVAWLCSSHIDDVCKAGAQSGELVLFDANDATRADSDVPRAPRVLEARYRFADRDAFAAYERDHAVRLRGDGLAAFARLGVVPSSVGGPLPGVVFTRTAGAIAYVRARG